MTAVASPAPPAEVRQVIRDVLNASTAFQTLPSDTRREVAHGLVRISSTALALAAEGNEAAPVPPATLSRAQNAGEAFSGVAAQRVADTTRQILNAVSFPRFVTELITGVFKAIVDSNQQQMQAYVELIRNVAATTEGFADANLGATGARQWLVERFPGSFEIQGDTDDDFPPDPENPPTREEIAERDAANRLKLRPGAAMPSEGALKASLGLQSAESLPGGDPENLVGFARSALARNRQQMLATMVMLGMQRLVIESGRLHASMRFHIDTRSAAADDRGSSLDVRNETSVAGSFGYGPWGVDAKMKNTIGYVSTQRTQTTEEMNTDLDLNSSVELVFKTDYLPLDRLAGKGQVDRIRVQTLNPDAEAKVAADERKARRDAQGRSDKERRDAVPVTPPPIARPTAPLRTEGTPPQPGAPQPGAPQPGAPQPGAPQPGAPQPGAPQPGAPQPGAPQQGGTQAPGPANPPGAANTRPGTNAPNQSARQPTNPAPRGAPAANQNPQQRSPGGGTPRPAANR
jgi:hypothetical protein